MRALKYIFIGLAVVILSFLSIGLLHPSLTYENTFTVDASLDHSFDVFTNDSLGPDWLIGYKSYEILEGEPHVPGSKFLMKFEVEGQPFEFTETLVEFKENEKFAFTMDTDFFTGDVDITFSGDSTSTSITAVTTNYGKGIFNRSMIYLMKSSLKEQSQLSYNNLKELIESTK